MRVAARAPNHLGDGVIALPAMHALAAVGRLVIHAPRWGPELYRDVDAEVLPRRTMDRADVAVVFPPSLRAAWQARRSRRRIGTPTDGRGWLLTDRVPHRPHRAALYAELAERAGARVAGWPRYPVRPEDPPCDVPEGHLALAPMTRGGPARAWTGFRALGDAAPGAVVFYGGPGEERALAELAGPHHVAVPPTLPALAACLRRCAVLVANDSGLAHFGRAVGVPVVAVFGSTVPAWTGAPGAVPVQGPALPCRPCYARTCRVGDRRCLDVGVDAVWDAIRRARGHGRG